MKNPIFRLGEVTRIDGSYVTVKIKKAKEMDFLSPGIDLNVGQTVCVKYANGFAQIEEAFDSANPAEIADEFLKYLKA